MTKYEKDEKVEFERFVRVQAYETYEKPIRLRRSYRTNPSDRTETQRLPKAGSEPVTTPWQALFESLL